MNVLKGETYLDLKLKSQYAARYRQCTCIIATMTTCSSREDRQRIIGNSASALKSLAVLACYHDPAKVRVAHSEDRLLFFDASQK